MEKKARIGRSALLIIGIIYTALGGIFVILGIALAALLRDSDAFMVGLIFGGIGTIFLILGIVFLIVELCKKKRRMPCLPRDTTSWARWWILPRTSMST